MTNQADVGHMVTLPTGRIGRVMAISQGGSYWVQIGSRVVVADPERCTLNGRYVIPGEEQLWTQQDTAIKP